MKVITIVGARPQFIKAGQISKELRKISEEIIIHTGQHYDYNMSKSFFEELGLPEPDYNLQMGNFSSSEQMGKTIIEIEKILDKCCPDAVIVYGDTNSTLAGAIAANQKNIRVVHVEAGLRSFDKSMPEEINRIITDHCSDILFCPTEIAVNNLKNEGITRNVFQVGDPMYDIILKFKNLSKTDILKKLNLDEKGYFLATIHRQSNVDIAQNLSNLIEAFKESKEKIVFPLHPRTLKCLKKYKIHLEGSNIIPITPVSYLEMMALTKHAKKILTDSGGLQKEAFFLGTPCITLRENTEWTETIENGWNILVGVNKKNILKAIKEFNPSQERRAHYGDGSTSKQIAKILKEKLGFP